MNNIYIVGNGGIGSNLSVPLLKFLQYYRKENEIDSALSIIIIDGDIIEKKNFIRQLFLEEESGENKATVTSEYLSGLFNIKNVKIESMPYYLKEDNIDIIKEDSVIFVGVDNYITRMLIEEKIESMEKVFVIYGGNEYDDGDVNIVVKENNKFITPKYQETHPEIRNKDKFPDEIGCEEASLSSPQLIFANMIVALYMLEAFYSYVTQQKIDWYEKLFDLKTGQVRTRQLDKNLWNREIHEELLTEESE